MNAGMIGADTGALRRMATQFDDAAHQLMGVKGSIQPWVDMTDIWLGLNYYLFKDLWELTGARTIIDAASILHHCADVVRANADSQEGVSSRGSAGGGSGSGLFGRGAEAARGGSGIPGGDGAGNRFDIDMSTPKAVHEYVSNSLKVLKAGADVTAYVNHRQFIAAASDGNIPLMNFHLMHEIDATNLSKFWKTAGDSLGHVGNAVTVLGSVGDLTSGSPSERLMAAVHMSTAGLSYLGPIGRGGATIINAFESVMPTTSDQQSDVLEYGLNRMYPGADINNLTPEQAQAIANRYNGVKGFGTMLADTAGNHVENGVETVKKFSEGVSDAVGDASSFLFKRFGG